MSHHQPMDSPPSQPPAPRVGFLDLSAELRNKIYSHLLHSKKEIHLWWTHDKDHRNARVKRNYHYKKRVQVYPQILRVCKQVHDEATPVLYGSNRFSLCEPQDVVAFVDQIGDSSLFLRYIEVEWPGMSRAPVKDWMATMLNRLGHAKALVRLVLPGQLREKCTASQVAHALKDMRRVNAIFADGKYDAASLTTMVRFRTRKEYYQF